MPNATVIDRNQVSEVIDRICQRPTFIFSVTCERRTDLHLRYPPVDMYTNGPLAYVGDATRVADRERVRFCGNCGRELTFQSRKCGGRDGCGEKREKIVLEEVGTLRKMIIKGKNDDKSTKHWEAKPDGKLAFDPAEKGLKLVAGMYSDAPKDFGCGKREGRHGQWRSWCLICLRTTQTIIYCGHTYLVAG